VADWDTRRHKDWLEARRLHAWELRQRGWQQRDIAEALGVTPAAVSQWFKQARAGGEEALRQRPVSGAPAKLTTAERERLPTLLERGARVYGFPDDRWTLERVAAVIRAEFGVAYHPSHVGRILKALGWRYRKSGTWASERVKKEARA
jgi:transposase